jgi:hypothetical protein
VVVVAQLPPLGTAASAAEVGVQKEPAALEASAAEAGVHLELAVVAGVAASAVEAGALPPVAAAVPALAVPFSSSRAARW